MSDTIYEVRQSKKMVIFASISAGILELFLIGLAVMFLIAICGNYSLTFDEYVICSLSLGFSIVFAIVIAIMLVHIILNYKYQLDVYMDDRMYRKKGDKIIFELEYKNIISMRQGIESIYLYCKEPIIKKNGKKGPKTLYEHYPLNDIYRIKQIIASSKDIF